MSKPVTPGQIKLGRGMEKRMEVSMSDWESMTHAEARDRIAILMALSGCLRAEGARVLKMVPGGYWMWEWHPDDREFTSFDRLLSD